MNYTDADVARMVGLGELEFVVRDDSIFTKSGDLISFGLTYHPHNDTNANVARYVLPWAYKQYNRVMIDYDDDKHTVILGNRNGREVDWYEHEGYSDWGRSLCIALLEAERKRNDFKNEG